MAEHAHITATVTEHPALVRHRLRTKLERVIDKLIAALDAVDAPETELEPELGSVAGGDHWSGPDQRQWADGQDAEPSLGSTGGTGGHAGQSQLFWTRGGNADLEDEHDGSEPDAEGEDGGDREPDLHGDCVPSYSMGPAGEYGLDQTGPISAGVP